MKVNNVVIAGIVEQDKYSHNAHDLDFRELIIGCKRNSGVKDLIKVIYQEKTKQFNEGEKVSVYGTIRSRREGKVLQLYVYADEIEKYEGQDINEVMIEGYICSDPYYKELKNRRLTQFLICSENNRKVYGSILIWKKTGLQMGNKIIACGRLQSRNYKKENGEKMVHEISAYKVEKC